MENSIDMKILADLANETGRHYGKLPDDFSPKMVKRIKRKFHSNIDASLTLTLVNHYKNIYGFCASILKGFISPIQGKYASLAHVKFDKYMNTVAAEYPDDDKSILKIFGDWAVYYEYLR